MFWFFRQYSTFKAFWILYKEQFFACLHRNRLSIDYKAWRCWIFAWLLESSLRWSIIFHKMIGKSAFSWVLSSINTTKNQLKLGILRNNFECLMIYLNFILLINESQCTNLAYWCFSQYAAMICHLILRQLVYFWWFGFSSKGRWLFDVHIIV